MSAASMPRISRPFRARGRSFWQIRSWAASVESVARRGEEVREHGIEVDGFPDVRHLLDDSAHQTEPERGVGDLVSDRGAAGQDAVLDPQVSDAVVHPVAGPVPPVHRAVEQLQGGQARHAAGLDRLEWVFLDLAPQQHPEPGHVGLEDLDHGLVDPLAAEADASRHVPDLRDGAARVDGLLEHRDARLGPQPPAEHER